MIFGRRQHQQPQTTEPNPPANPPGEDLPGEGSVSEKETSPTPSFVTEEKFTQFQNSMFERLDNVTNYFMTQNKATSTAPSTPEAAKIEDVTDEEYESALAGEIPDKRKAAQIVQKRHTAIAKREKVDIQQQLAQLQSIGIGAIGNLTQQSLVNLPHYKTYQKEIETAIGQLGPADKVNATVLREVYNLVIGRHVDEIIENERKAVLRQQMPSPTDTSPPGGRRTSADSKKQPSSSAPDPTEVLSPEALQTIKYRFGSTGPGAIERFVQSQGEKDWPSYYDRYYKPLENTQGNA
jgi:hypothetical protein